MVNKVRIYNTTAGLLCEGEWPFRSFPRSGDLITDDEGDEHEVDFLIFDRQLQTVKIWVKA